MIKTHKELAALVAGKTVLHLNSLGKDSLVALAWLATYAQPGRVNSLFFERFTLHPEERAYLEYQRRAFPNVQFFVLPDPIELTQIIEGMLQPPDRAWAFQDLEYQGFSRDHMIREAKEHLAADFVCDGTSGYEGMGRAQKFHNKGLHQGDRIYPLGLMKKKDLVNLIAQLNLKLNPTYRHYGSTFDEASYYRMRAAFRRNSEFRETFYKFFPFMRLDEYRWEKLINGPKDPEA